jgi:hypothetical protein
MPGSAGRFCKRLGKMGWLSFWGDEVSRKLESEKKDAAGLWKASNALLRSALVLLPLGVVLLFLVVSELLSSGFELSSSSSIFTAAPLAFLALFGSAVLLSLYAIAVALLAAVFNEFGWAGSIFAFGVPAFYYKYKKGKELRGAEITTNARH